MRDYLAIGPAPAEEPCAQVGDPDYRAKVHAECRRFIEVIRAAHGPEPGGARLATASFPHDFGVYHEVVCWYDPDVAEEVEYAFRCEAEAPGRWPEEGGEVK